MKVTENIKKYIINICNRDRDAFGVELEPFFKFLSAEKISADDFYKLWQSYRTEIKNRAVENRKLVAAHEKPLPAFNFDNWAKTIK